MDIEKSPDDKIPQETSGHNKVAPESRPEEKPKEEGTEQVASSNEDACCCK